MGETTDQIENYIDQKRDDLGSNLKELEGKVRGMTDWRQQYHKSPLTAVAIAFGGGIVLASMLAGKSNGEVAKCDFTRIRLAPRRHRSPNL